MIEIAAEEAMIQRLADLPSHEELEKMYPPTSELENRVKKIIANESKRRKNTKASHVFLKVAAGIGIIFVLGTVVLMSVEASRNFIRNTIINVQDDHVAFESSGNNAHGISVDSIAIEGFAYVRRQSLGQITISTYENMDGGQITVTQSRGGNLGMAIDTDYRDFTTQYINGRQVFLFESLDIQERHVARWEVGETVFHVHAYIGIQEFLLFLEYLLGE